MALIGAGCSAVLMAALYIFARSYPPAVFASLSGLLIGAGSAGNVASAAPMAWVVEAVGWRATLWGLAAATLATALAVLALVRDPERVAAAADGGLRVGFGAVLRRPALLLLVPLTLAHYAPVAGVRGLWAGPYLADVFGLDPVGDRQRHAGDGRGDDPRQHRLRPARPAARHPQGRAARRQPAARRRAAGALGPARGRGSAVAAALLCAVGFFGMSFPLMVAHGRSHFPPHLAGRGVTFLNLLAIGGAGLAQIASGPIARATAAAAPESPAAPYAAIFLFFAAC